MDTSEALGLDVIRGGKLIPIIPKTKFSFDGADSSEQIVPLKTRIDARAFASIVLVARIHDVNPSEGGAEEEVLLLHVFNESVEHGEEQTEFVATSPLATIAVELEEVVSGTLLVANSAGSIGSHVRVVVGWHQDLEGEPQDVTMSVDLIGRTHVNGLVVPRDRREFRMPAFEPDNKPSGVVKVRTAHGGFAFFVRDPLQPEGVDFDPAAFGVTETRLSARQHMAARAVDQGRRGQSPRARALPDARSAAKKRMRDR
ncbi:MAG TPA: hypothetical protein VFB62_28015 [Polyangiaceae bacterium]|nr:hypothetical protein [Polyangiaceae bacterium]